MNGMFWDQVICDAKIEEITEKGNKTFTRCDGVMLPIERNRLYFEGTITQQFVTDKIWKCHKCGREVK